MSDQWRQWWLATLKSSFRIGPGRCRRPDAAILRLGEEGNEPGLSYFDFSQQRVLQCIQIDCGDEEFARYRPVMLEKRVLDEQDGLGRAGELRQSENKIGWGRLFE